MSNENKEVKEIKEIAKVEDTGKITYANDVIAKIAALAASEVKGVAGTTAGSFQDMFAGKSLTKGLKVTVTDTTVAVELHVIIEYGSLIHKVCVEVQDSIIKAVESMTDLKVVAVDVHVGSIKMPEVKE